MSFVFKRGGHKEPVKFDKITARVERLCYELDPVYVDAVQITQKVILGVYPGVNTIELDNLAAEAAVGMATTHPDYLILAARIAVSNLHKQTKDLFSEVSRDLYEYVDPQSGNRSPFISKENYDVIIKHADALDRAIDYRNDFTYDYFGFKTLERAYLLRIKDKIIERPQHMLMRIAVAIHGDDLPNVIDTYKLMSQKYYIHSSPTLFNAGTPFSQLSLSFLAGMKDDSLEGIYDTLKNCALILKSTGGIGLHIHNVRATGLHILGTNGTSLGIIPMIRVFNNTARYVDQGGNKRPGAFALYLEPWHADIEEFVALRSEQGTLDIFPALWIPDLFMERVEQNQEWALFSPNEVPGLSDTYGDEFRALYEKYEQEGKKVRQRIKAQDLWQKIVNAQIATGTPFFLYKDACNRKLNQQNVGVIKGGNLCCEVILYLDRDNVLAPMMALISLPEFIKKTAETVEVDFEKLHAVVKKVAKNLDMLIDKNLYPVTEAKNANLRNRPVAIGVQGLADFFLVLQLPFESSDAKDLNIQIFETIYHAAIESSIELAMAKGAYPNYDGSPALHGLLQFDLWGVKPTGYYDWEATKEQMARYGLRNSVLVALMPTASTSIILGNSESFEPIASNVYIARISNIDIHIINKYLMRELVEMGIWSPQMKDAIVRAGGLIQNIVEIPQETKDLFKTKWDIKQKTLVDMTADRAPFIDQSQALNISMINCSVGRLSLMHFHGWKKGLKTGMYYLRTQSDGIDVKYVVEKEPPQYVENVARPVVKPKPKRYVRRRKDGDGKGDDGKGEDENEGKDDEGNGSEMGSSQLVDREPLGGMSDLNIGERALIRA